MVRCNNGLFEHWQEWHPTLRPYKAKSITPRKQTPTNASTSEPTQIDSLRFKKQPQKERDWQHREDLYLYLYYSGKNYQAQDCLIKALALKLHKVRNISTNIQSNVKDTELENKDV
jgi:hypothetical protein